ncbi:MAG: PrgI family protein [Lachnospiraceae bacterium]|nr:PrgI family protein [Lachnospiraceae bacterium]
MASYITIPRDLSKVKTKVIFNLTKRQLICFGSGALIGVPVFFVLKHFGVEISNAVMVMMIIMIPFFLFAMYERNGRPLEKVLGNIIEVRFKRPKVRPYGTDNYYNRLLRERQVRKEVKRIVSKKSV